MNILKNFLTTRVVKYWKRVPRQAVEILLLEIFKTWFRHNLYKDDSCLEQEVDLDNLLRSSTVLLPRNSVILVVPQWPSGGPINK